MPLSLFITGADGFLGTHLLQRIDTARYRNIRCLTLFAGRTHPAPNVRFIQGDLLNPHAYSTSLAECDTVLHMAAITGKAPRDEYFRVNREGTNLLLEAARRAGVRRFVFVSSIAARFQDQGHYYYAQSKRQAEELVARSGLEYTIVRPTILMGANAPVMQSLEKLAGAPVVPVIGDGGATVQPVFAGDLATCLLHIVEHGNYVNQIVEIGGPESLTIEELLLKIRHIRFGKPARVLHLPAAPIMGVLSLLEKCLFPILPVTAGQLESFVNDGTVQAGFTGACAPGKTVDEILRHT